MQEETSEVQHLQARARRSAGFYPTHVLHMYVLYQTSYVCMCVTRLRSHLMLAQRLSREGPCAGFYPTRVLHMFAQEPHTKFYALRCFTRGLTKEIEELRRSTSTMVGSLPLLRGALMPCHRAYLLA